MTDHGGNFDVASFGNPGGMHDHGVHTGAGGAHIGGKVIAQAVSFAHVHSGGRTHFTTSGISHAHANQADISNDDAIDPLRQVVTYDMSLRSGVSPTRMLLVHDTN